MGIVGTAENQLGRGTTVALSQDGPFDGIQDKPVRVCLISPLSYGLYHPESGRPFGGAEVQFYLMARELSADPGFPVSVLATVDEGTAGVEQLDGLQLVRRGGRKRLGSKGQGTLHGCLSAFRDMYRTLRAIDADVYLHAGAGIEVGAYALICRILRRRFIFVVASSADLAIDPPNVRGPLRFLYPLGLRMADAVICRTEEQRVSVRERVGCQSILIRSGHALPTGAPSPADKSTILWVGRMHPLKQPGLFLDLAARLPKNRFVMVASHDREHQDLRQDVLRRAALLSNVTVIEDVPWSDVGRFFAEAKLLVNTSTYEGFPNTFVQAGLDGTPIVSWTVDPDRVLARHRIGLCAGGAFERLADQVRQLCENEPLRQEMGHRAAMYARDHHDVCRTTGQFKALMRAMLSCG